MNRTSFSFVAIVGLLFLATFACAVLPSTPGTPAPTRTRNTTIMPPLETITPTYRVGPTVTPTTPLNTFRNPVIDADFPDPDILKAPDAYYAFATNSGGENVLVARSLDLVTWERLPDALPELPKWSVPNLGYVWAPDVSQPVAEGDYLLYYTARFVIGTGGAQCIGAASSQSVAGQYTPLGDQPLVCQVGEGGSIDPASFVDDDGQRYLLWKNDGNTVGSYTWIYVQAVSQDGLNLAGEPVQLFKASEPWEGGIVEAPTLWKHGGRYFLFYSANSFDSPDYAVGYAVADNILGPYQKASEPILKSDQIAGFSGPGGQDIVLAADGETWMLFHSWTPGGYRSLNLIKLIWDNDLPRIDNPGHDPIEVP